MKAWSLPEYNQFFLFEDSWWGSRSIAQFGSCTNKLCICERRPVSTDVGGGGGGSKFKQAWTEATWRQVKLTWDSFNQATGLNFVHK